MTACTDFPAQSCVIASGCGARSGCWRTEDAALSKRPLDQIMAEMPESWRAYWCETEVCGCAGCANVAGRLSKWGFTKQQWEEWRDAQRRSGDQP